MMKTILLTIEYDGTNFCGWQKQPGRRSVQGELERVLSIVCAQPIRINGTSRTDAGVHAFGQRASFTADLGIPTDRIPVAANPILASSAAGKGGKHCKLSGDISIREAREMPSDFHARFHACGKKYLYRIKISDQADVFGRNYHYQISKPLDLNEMRKAAALMTGTHDFKCFQSAGGQELETTVRTIYSIEIRQEECAQILIEFKGDGFLYNMVRIMTGTLVEIGLGKLPSHRIPLIIESKNRQLAGHTAPPQGLYLAEVYYGKENLHENQGYLPK